MTDYYVQHPEALEGQPKRTLGDYVEQHGILVPRRFDILADGRKSKRPLFYRTEHWQDYAGASDLLDSFGFQEGSEYVRGAKTIDEVKERYFLDLDNPKFSEYKRYCEIMNIDEETFRDQVSISIWEKIGGVNRTVIADPNIFGRYHIMSVGLNNSEPVQNYTLFEDGKIIKQFVGELPSDFEKGLEKLIQRYEEVRSLDRFDTNHSYIMEFQTFDSKDYFLQIHRCRDFKRSTFVLNREIKKGEFEVPFVRGFTKEGGEELEILVLDISDEFSTDERDGSCSARDFGIDLELKIRNRKLQMFTQEDIHHYFRKVITNHNSKSMIFKPEIFIFHTPGSIFRDDEYGKIVERAIRSKLPGYIKLHVESDGRRCIVKRIE